MNLEEMVQEIEEVRHRGENPYNNMVFYIDKKTHTNLLSDSYTFRASQSSNWRIEEIFGIDVVIDDSVEPGLYPISPRKCSYCKSDKTYHDRREEWLCPFCEI